MESIRTFIAVELPGDIKKRLDEVEDSLKALRIGAKWVAPESIHLTLKFLGEISTDTVKGVTDVIEEAALGIPEFRLKVRGLGVFPDPRRVRVVWAGLEGEVDKLVELQKRLDRGLEKLGFVPESRPFTPHLTLARVRDDTPAVQRQSMAKLVESTAFEGGEFSVDSLSLMRSQLRREGAIYTRLVSVPLLG